MSTVSMLRSYVCLLYIFINIFYFNILKQPEVHKSRVQPTQIKMHEQHDTIYQEEYYAQHINITESKHM